jgi:rhizosphere induced protein
MFNMPSGTIVAFAGNQVKIPDGWHECDGTTLDATKYPDLYAVIGTLYGGQGNPGFKLPDYRGYFLRGTNTGNKYGPDQNRELGNVQQESVQRHHHNYTGHHLEASGGTGFEGSGFDANSDPSGWTGPYNTSSDVFLPEKNGTPPDKGLNMPFEYDETRPVNVSVLYLIKL